MELVKGFLKILFALIGLLILGVVIFFFMNSYTSPVREAGREFKQKVRSYRNDEVENMEDVYERMDVLQDHYNSQTHSKMQGGEKTQVMSSHIETMFGEPDAVHEDVEKGYGAISIYQYKYGAETLNFHEDWSGGIEEFIFEDYSDELYEAEEMDDLFFNAIQVHQANYEKVDDEYEPFPENDISSFTTEKKPTRKISQGGWFTWPRDYELYFDDGAAELSPEEFLLLQISMDDEENSRLEVTYRRYRGSFVEATDPDEIEEKIGLWNDLNRQINKIEKEELDEVITVQDIADDFGEITHLTYNFRTGVLEVNWMVLEPDEMPFKVSGLIPITEDIPPTTKADIYDLQVQSVQSDHLFTDASIVRTDDFIGQ